MSRRWVGEMSILDPVGAGLPPLPDAAEGLALGDMSIRGEATTVGAGDHYIVLS